MLALIFLIPAIIVLVILLPLAMLWDLIWGMVR